MIDNDTKRTIAVARKYKIIPGTTKCDIFVLFEEGYSPREVSFILSNLKEVYDNPKTFTNNIRRYYFDWKKSQKD